jgi:VWFA-related protein
VPRRLFVLAVTLTIAAAPAGIPAQTTDRTGPAIRISAVITDGAGRPIPRLSTRDLELRDDGVVVPVDTLSLKSSTAPAGADDAADLRPSTRAFAIVLDEFHVSAGAATDRVRDALSRFVREQLSDDDLGVVFKPLDSLGAIRLTRDRTALESAIASFSGRKGDYEPRTVFERNYVGHAPGAIDAARVQILLSALRSIATQLGEMRVSTSAIVFVSEGFAADGRGRAVDPRLPDLTAVVRSAIRFDVPIYAFDPQEQIGVQPARLEAAGDDTGARAMLRRVTGETGGDLVPDGGDLSAGLERMARDLTSRYVLAFRSPHGRDGKYHAIELRVTRRDARVRAVAGYWTPLPVEPRRTAAAPLPFASGRMLHRSPLIDAWVGVTRQPDGTARMSVTWEPSRRTSAARGLGIITLTATTPDGRVLYSADLAAAHPPGEGTGIAADRAAFDVPAGRVQLDMKIVAEDGRVLDNEARDVDVPDLRTPRRVIMTTEIVRTRNAREFRIVSADPDAAPAAGRDFSRTERLLIRVPAYDPVGAPPRIAVMLLNRWGQTLRELAPMPDAPGSAQFDLPLAAFAPGDYILQITATGAGGENKEAITIRITQ